jgi:hypothetical protein
MGLRTGRALAAVRAGPPRASSAADAPVMRLSENQQKIIAK